MQLQCNAFKIGDSIFKLFDIHYRQLSKVNVAYFQEKHSLDSDEEDFETEEKADLNDEEAYGIIASHLLKY